MKIKEKFKKVSIRDFWDLKTTRDRMRIAKRILNRIVNTHCHPELNSGSPEEQAERQGKKNKNTLRLRLCRCLQEIPKQVRDDCHSLRFNKDILLKSIIESGRSMVEMLGVLAVIGVLSVAAIMGYRYAMNKYQANKIANEMNLVGTQIAVALMKTHTGEFEVTVGSPYDEERLSAADYPFYYGCGTDTEVIAPCQQNEKSYYEMLENVPQSICQPLVQMTQHLPYLVEQRINGTEDYTGSSCQEDNNQIILLFEVDEYNAGDYETSQLPVTSIYETTPFVCENNDDCAYWWGSYRPVCDLTSNQCIGCLYESDCAPFSYAPACYIASGQERGYCVACTDDRHCASKAATPACRTNTHQCVQCTTDEHCATVAGLPVCKTTTYKCVQCLQNSDCTDEENPYCETSTNVCGECQKDSDCAAKHDDLPYCFKGVCKPCKSNYVMRPDSKTMSNGLTYHEFCYNYEWVDWSTGNSNGCHLFGTGYGADTFCKAQSGLPSIYDLLLISDNPLKYKEGDEVTACYRTHCYTYTGPFPTTDAYKGKWKEMCPGTSDRPRFYTSVNGIGQGHVEVNMKTGTLGVTEDGSGNYWLTVACKDYLNRVSY